MNTKMLKTIDEIIIRASSLVTTILTPLINLTTGVYHMNNQQLSANLERAWETERENKEVETLFGGNEHDED